MKKYLGIFGIMFDVHLHCSCFPFRKTVKNFLQQRLHQMWLIPWKFSGNF